MRTLTPTEKLHSGFYFEVPACLDVVQPELTEQAIAAAEAELGVKLPETYLVLLRKQNGGYLRATWPATYTKMLRGIGSKAPSLRRANFRRELNPSSWAPKQAESLIVFDGDDTWDMCFDYRKRGPQAEPTITLLDVECEEEEPIAASFTAYLNGLVDKLAGSTRLYAEVNAKDVAHALAKQLGASVPRVDASTLGFVKWRIALRGDHQWCWVSDNRVARSYAREAGERVTFSAERALQLPEDPACAVLLSCTEDARARAEVAAALAALELVPAQSAQAE